MSQNKQPFDREGALLGRVRVLLKDAPMTDLEIYRETGLNPGWLDAVRRGVTANPSVNRVEHLYKFLTGSELTV